MAFSHWKISTKIGPDTNTAMTRPRCDFRIGFCPPNKKFNPEGHSENDCPCVELSAEEVEALRLKNIKGLDQTAAAEKMGISQSTFQRVLSGAYKKVSDALINGKAIKIIDKK